MSIQKSTFPGTLWQGIAPSLRSRLDDSTDFKISDQHAAELIAIQEYLSTYVDILRMLGDPNTVLGVNAEGTALEYKTLTEGSGGITPYNSTNDNAGAIVICQPVYPKSNGHIDLAQADNTTTSRVIGLVKDASIASAGAGDVQTVGPMTATTGQWDAVTGQSGGLTAGSPYYLDPTTPGVLTTVAPNTVGQFVVPVGVALTATQMNILPQSPIAV